MSKDDFEIDLAEVLQQFADQGMTIVIGDQQKVSVMYGEVLEVLRALGFEEAFVTDESMIGDFPLDEDELAHASAELGVLISRSDYLHEVAGRIAQERLASKTRNG